MASPSVMCRALAITVALAAVLPRAQQVPDAEISPQPSQVHLLASEIEGRVRASFAQQRETLQKSFSVHIAELQAAAQSAAASQAETDFAAAAELLRSAAEDADRYSRAIFEAGLAEARAVRQGVADGRAKGLARQQEQSAEAVESLYASVQELVDFRLDNATMAASDVLSQQHCHISKLRSEAMLSGVVARIDEKLREVEGAADLRTAEGDEEEESMEEGTVTMQGSTLGLIVASAACAGGFVATGMVELLRRRAERPPLTAALLLG